MTAYIGPEPSEEDVAAMTKILKDRVPTLEVGPDTYIGIARVLLRCGVRLPAAPMEPVCQLPDCGCDGREHEL